MKKRMLVAGMLCAAVLSGCGKTSAEKADFRFCGAEWGEDWEAVQEATDLRGEISEGAVADVVEIDEAEYMGQRVQARLQFSPEDSQSPGLCTVVLRYEDQDEEALLSAMETVYGERRESYEDENGVANPIQPAGWVSEETFEDLLSDEGKEYFSAQYADMEPTRVDAVLRQPQVVIHFDEASNLVTLEGNTVAAAKLIEAQSGV